MLKPKWFDDLAEMGPGVEEAPVLDVLAWLIQLPDDVEMVIATHLGPKIASLQKDAERLKDDLSAEGFWKHLAEGLGDVWGDLARQIKAWFTSLLVRSTTAVGLDRAAGLLILSTALENQERTWDD